MAVPKLPNEMNKSKEILVNFCMKSLVRIGMSMSRKSCTARTKEEGRHVFSKLRRAASMEIALQGREAIVRRN